MPWLSHPLQFVLVALAGWINQQQRDVIDYLQEENRILREQIGARRLRFTDDGRRRLAVKARTLGRRFVARVRLGRDAGHVAGVAPNPHVRAVRRQYASWSWTAADHAQIRGLIVRMATENRSWGYTRIQGALANLHHEVSRGTIANVLREHGLEPAPDRLKKTSGPSF
jgi:hypothetical protein